MPDPHSEAALETTQALANLVFEMATPIVEDVDLTDGGEVQLFVYYPEVPCTTLVGSYLQVGEEVRGLIAFGASAVLAIEQPEPFYVYAVVRRPTPDGLELVYSFPDHGLVHVPIIEDDPESRLVLLEVESEIPEIAAGYFEAQAGEVE